MRPAFVQSTCTDSILRLVWLPNRCIYLYPFHSSDLLRLIASRCYRKAKDSPSVGGFRVADSGYCSVFTTILHCVIVIFIHVFVSESAFTHHHHQNFWRGLNNEIIARFTVLRAFLQRIALRASAIAIHLSVCLSVCPSHVGTGSKWWKLWDHAVFASRYFRESSFVR